MGLVIHILVIQVVSALYESAHLILYALGVLLVLLAQCDLVDLPQCSPCMLGFAKLSQRRAAAVGTSVDHNRPKNL